jgi:SAM-dependent methyltransferase
MSEHYNQAVATHYSSYRPPLHEMILEYVLSNEKVFNKGLDVGCGTGYSAVALAKHCLHVYGIDPSQSMLEKARPHEKITYQQGTGEDLPLPDKSVDVVTFAGSLFYTKSEQLIKELKRVCRNRALVIPYDFEVLLDDVLLQCGINLEEAGSDYEYEVNFSDSADFIEIVIGNEQIDLEVTAVELAHILLSSSQHYEAFVEKYDISDPFLVLVTELERAKEQQCLKVNIYFSKYQPNGR